MLIPYLTLFFILGVLIYFSGSIILISAALTALFLIFINKRSLIYFLIAFLVLGILVANFKHSNFVKKEELLRNNNIFDGYIAEKNSDSYLIVNYKENYKILLYTTKEFSPGDYIKIYSKFEPIQTYKKKNYYSRGIIGKIKENENFTIINKKTVLSSLVKIKYFLINRLTLIDKKAGGLIAAILFGYTSNMKEEYKIFNDLGLSHFLAVSGFNLGIIFLFFNRIFECFGANLRKILSLIICFIFILISSLEPSVLRAFIMIAFVSLSKIVKRPSLGLNNLFIAALLMLLFNPYLIFNRGFIFSYLATFSILILGHYIKNANNDISAALSTFLFITPISLIYNGYFSIYSLILNIILSPFIGILTILSFLSSIIFLVFKLDIFLFPPLFFGIKLFEIITKISKYNIQMFFSMNYITLVSYYLLIFINLIKKEYRKFNYILVLFLISSILYNPKNLKVNIINVGQGDSILIETPYKKVILIDTGPSFDDYIAAKEKIVPFIKRKGYNKIDLLIITHPHKDHFSGFYTILNNFNVYNIAAPFNIDNIKSTLLLKGDEVVMDGVVLKVLYPEVLQQKDDKNENAIVLELSFKDFYMLLPSDVDLDNIDLENKDYDIVQLPHHGSIKSFDINTAEKYKFSVAVVSVGKNNFGHPSNLLMEYLYQRGVRIFRTDINGNITIHTDGKKYFIKGDFDDS
ncbi:DNA internalization-related competence protein ComEC/Rec2 [Caloramator australicus]|uniref:Late competence protein ComEC, DNA transport n=1 Tax=Caloramator australicus RC3 TaxID=857293 RepID=I7LHZ1_9CLOT|nr:DNA internalization-related competence protein ComEC/Rec2 [Caloramator australicus]CCJ34396.1 Late competence protein ComEC, DNA transport [Caloramator australicus RC3]